MKIAFFEVSDEDRRYLQQALSSAELIFCAEPLTAENASLAQDCEVVSVFIYSKVGQAELDLLPRLRFVTTRSTGFDHIELEACVERGVRVANVPYYGENTVAEHTFALILALSRNVHKSYVRTLRNDFSIDGLRGFDLKDKTLGVIGTGHIGMHVIRIAKGFGMHVLAYDIKQDTFLSEVLHYRHVSLDELLGQSDIISLHVPYNKHTHHLINSESIQKIKPGALLINTSRGALVDNNALIKALDQKILAGAGLDVLEGEELIREEKQLLHDAAESSLKFEELFKNHLLLSQDNVVFTPHIAFYSNEALKRILDTTLENIADFQAGKLRHAVEV
jgi:D-lactate dehydrogenase